MFFKKQKIAEEPLIPKQKSTFALSSDYGRGISSLASEVIENWREAKIYNPVDFIKDDLDCSQYVQHLCIVVLSCGCWLFY